MQTLIARLFWVGVIGVLFAALYDCAWRPEETRRAWKRYQPLAWAIVAIAAGFFLVNLLRDETRRLDLLIPQTLRIAGVAVGMGVFFCGGFAWVVMRREAARSVDKTAGKPPVGRTVVETLLLSLFAVGLSVAILYRFEPKPTGEFQKWLDEVDRWTLRSGFFVVMVILAPLWEEAAFRWYLLNRIGAAWRNRRWGSAAAVVATSAFWACGHAAVSDPMWPKLGQIFIIGCLLGWRFPAIGLPGCVIVHLSVNATALVLSAASP